ncbi:MAG: hypothetical protein RI897_3733 [Verrucomicrobiota bacterium]
MLQHVLECAHSAAQILLQHFNQPHAVRIKESPSSIVTEADLASDQYIRDYIQQRFPDHNVLTEESGFINRRSQYTWIADPLDGTSNFAAGLSWFGVMISLLDNGLPTAAAMVLPAEELVYTAELGKGALKNGKPTSVSTAQSLDQILCAVGMDAHEQPEAALTQGKTLARIAQKVRNVRCTNSLVDFACTIDGRLGGIVNFNCMVWDIAAPLLILSEGGGHLSDLHGKPVQLSLDEQACQRSYAIVGAPPQLHHQLTQLTSTSS